MGVLLHPRPLQVLAHSPSPGLAPGVESPLLLPEALQFLEDNLNDDDYGVWKGLGTAWNKSRWGPALRHREVGSGFERGATAPTPVSSPMVAGLSTPTAPRCPRTSRSFRTGGCPP